MEIPHADLPEITGMVFIDVCPMVVLSTCHTATAGMLSVLAYAAVAGGDVAATRIMRIESALSLCFGISDEETWARQR